jgi:hypothetical protein
VGLTGWVLLQCHLDGLNRVHLKIGWNGVGQLIIWHGAVQCGSKLQWGEMVPNHGLNPQEQSAQPACHQIPFS